MKELANRLIEEAYENKNHFLDLGNCGLSELPSEIIKLGNFLTGINLGSWYYSNGRYNESINTMSGNRFFNTAALSPIVELKKLSYLSCVNCLLSDSVVQDISQLHELAFIDFENNGITVEGMEHMATLKKLKKLTVNNNPILLNGAIHISKHLNQLTSLGVGNCKIYDEGAIQIMNMSNLEELNISKNALSRDFSSKLTRLKFNLNNVNYLDISENDLGDDGIGFLSKIKNLKYLNISKNRIGDKGCRRIGKLPYLTTLIIEGERTRNNISSLGVSELCKLHTLENLNLANNRVGDDGAISISKLPSVMFLGLHHCDISHTGAEHISRMKSVTKLNLSFNRIGNIGAAHISNMNNLYYLNLSRNHLSEFNSVWPSSLKLLQLQHNELTHIRLETIKNINLEIVTETPKQISEGHIYIYDNPIINPPKEVLNGGMPMIMEYLQGNLKRLNECKVLFIGDGAVGKTSLMKRLVYNTFDFNERITHGINKIGWAELKNEHGETIKLNLWDFGGQHVQHALHQFFFTERVIYVLILNPRNDEKAGYWLDQINKLGQESQIIIVYNVKDEKDIQSDFLGNYRELRKKYGYLSEPIILSCATGDGMHTFKTILESVVLLNKSLKVKYPEQWFNIKTKLEAILPVERQYILYKQYEELCIEENYNNVEHRRTLLCILNAIGSIVFFDKPILDEYQVLNPEWITTGVYAIITSTIAKQKRGHIDWTNLKEIFSTQKEVFSDKNVRIEYRENQFKFILQLMLDYKLCQRNPFAESPEYLIPSLLGEKPNKQFDTFQSRHYRFKFQMPFEMFIIHKFISKNIINIIDDDYWDSGIYFKHIASNTFALVETSKYSQEINCLIKGENIRGMWEIIRADFIEIFNRYYNFPVDEEVGYVTENGTVFLKYANMIRALKDGIAIIPYDPQTGLKNIDVYYIIDLFETQLPPVVQLPIQIRATPVVTLNLPILNDSKESDSSTNEYSEWENGEIKKWRMVGLKISILMFFITIMLLLIWQNKLFFSYERWNWIENKGIDKWIIILFNIAWNSFIVKILYDRYLDPSKEKAKREVLKLQRSKNL